MSYEGFDEPTPTARDFEKLCGNGHLHYAQDGNTWMAQYVDDRAEWSNAYGFGSTREEAQRRLWAELTRYEL